MKEDMYGWDEEFDGVWLEWVLAVWVRDALFTDDYSNGTCGCLNLP